MIVSIIEIVINKNFYKFLVLYLTPDKDFCISKVLMVDSRNKVNSIFIRNSIGLVLSIIVSMCIAIKQSNALPHEWVGVPKSEYGEQFMSKTQAEKAYSSGALITSNDDNAFIATSGDNRNPLETITDWGEFRMSATMEGLVFSDF